MKTNKVLYSALQSEAFKCPSTIAKALVMKFLTAGEASIRPIFYQGTGRYTSVVDRSNEVKHILTTAGVEFVEGNDAPRGGRVGYFIIVTSEIEIG